MDAQQERAGDSHVVDIAPARELRIIMDATNDSAAQLNGGCPIVVGEVSSIARLLHPPVYTPRHVCIGPYHRTWFPNLARDEEKNKCVRAVLQSESTVEVCLDELTRLENQARSCYRHNFCMDSNQFVRMLLLDGCYLLACIKVDDAEEEEDGGRNGAPVGNCLTLEVDNRSGAPLVPASAGYGLPEDVVVVGDAFYLAENQIPFFIIEKIYQLAGLNAGTSTAAANPIVGYAQKLMEKHNFSVAKPALGGPSGPGNLLHLLHMHLKPTTVLVAPTGPTVTDKPVGRWRTAMEYHFAGIKFKSVTLGADGVRCILDVKLGHGSGTLEVPCLKIDGETWRLLRNLMALEQHNPNAAGNHVTAYCVFMSQVACRAEDVELLSKRGIIMHGLGNCSEVAVFFSNLCKGIVFELNGPGSNYLSATKLALEKRFQSRQRRWMASLKRERFSNPWVTVALMAAALGLVSAVVEAVYSVLSYRRGK